MRLTFFAALALLAPAALLAPTALSAQDTRTVTEPHIPSACATLSANLHADRGVIAAADETHLDTARIQSALDRCAPGHAVVLRSAGHNNIFLTGPLQLRSGVVLVVAAHTLLAASRDPRVYDIAPGSCGVVNDRGHGCKPLISADHATNSGIMGDGVIDGRGGAKLLGQSVSWWDLAHEAKVKDQHQSVPWLIVLHHADNFVLYRITLRNSPMFHVSVGDTDGFTAWGVKIWSPKTARNTDGIDPGSSRNVTITHCFIHTGDDNVAVKSGKAGPASHISVVHNHFYTGHGMSIGSGTDGGVDHMLVDDLTIDGADNGIRIKSDRSRGGLVHDIDYRNVCMRNVKNPLMFTPLYTTLPGNLLPVYRDIRLSAFHIETAGTYTLLGLDAAHKLGLQFDNVFADDQQHSRFLARDAVIALGPHKGNLAPQGSDVTVTTLPGAVDGTPLSCAQRYVDFPAEASAPQLAEDVPAEDHTLYVAADGTGEYSSIQKAIDAAPATGASILVAPGVYREVLTIDKPHIELRGAGDDPAKVVVVNDRSAGANGGTLHSATVNVTADSFHAENITFENDFNKTHPQLPAGSQALALLVTGDRATFNHVHLLGNQDTVYAASRKCAIDGSCPASRQYFSHCFIAGNVDFIFGDSKAVFDHCEIHSTAHKGGFLTAQSKSTPQQDSGYVFLHCKLTADPSAEPPIFLGRPWRPYATVIFIDNEMGAHIATAGWREWHPGETHSLDTAFYAEYHSTGPGAHPSERDPHAHLLTPDEVKQYLPAVFLRGNDNWNPSTPGASR